MNDLMMPAVGTRSFGLRDNNAFHHIAAGRNVLRFRSGRLALADALARSGVDRDSEVLVPAYHCQSMVEPIEALGARPVFYRVLPDLSVDLSDILRKLTRNTKSIIAAHFFGISCDLSELRGLCDEAGTTLVEDCAHCFSYSRSAPGYGVTGDFVITSPRKFLPIFDGGELFSPIHALPDDYHRSVDLRYQLKITANILERGWRRHRHNNKQLALDEYLCNADVNPDRDKPVASDFHEASNYVDPRFDFNYVKSPSSVLSRFMKRIISLERVEQARVRTFKKLTVASRSFRRGARAFPGLGRTSVPYVFPLILEEDGDLLHSRLRRAGVPMWRWEDLRESDCDVSNDYRQSLIQLPCHQELAAESVARMISALQEVLG